MKKMTLKERLDKRRVPGEALVLIYSLSSPKDIIFFGKYKYFRKEHEQMIPVKFNRIHFRRFYEVAVE